jgi:hypothetical protein
MKKIFCKYNSQQNKSELVRRIGAILCNSYTSLMGYSPHLTNNKWVLDNIWSLQFVEGNEVEIICSHDTYDDEFWSALQIVIEKFIRN